ncbi:MAG: UxaA family hydrolase [Steroidobacter sp.]
MNVSNFILLHPDDNVLICRKPAAKGSAVDLDGVSVVLHEDIHVGHKIARCALNRGDRVIKYGAPIGSIVTAVAAGDHVHLHNMQSDYIASHTRKVIS